MDCDWVYIGETGHPFHIRLKEHQRAVFQGDRRNANAVHHMEEDHEMDWEKARVLTREEDWKKRKIKESIHIRSRKTFNLDMGFLLSPVWTELIPHAN